jgi:hypothetical protein
MVHTVCAMLSYRILGRAFLGPLSLSWRGGGTHGIMCVMLLTAGLMVSVYQKVERAIHTLSENVIDKKVTFSDVKQLLYVLAHLSR